ncbi:MAG TPA: DNRLRE domain-containing protein [Actinomycetota bacterium]|nr:DNRLRE domain-containing protein [Actinomycetota bacterium]
MRRLAAILAAAVTAVLVAIPAGATTFTFKPVADSFVNSANPSTNYGGSAVIAVDASPTVRTYLRFDVQGLTGPAAKATLKLFAIDGSTTGYEVRTVSNNSWGERTINYSNAPSFSSSRTGSSGAFAASRWTSVDVTPAVSGNGTYSFAVLTSSATRIRFSSRQGDRPPRLVVETGPDTTPPSRPTGVTLSAVDFNWVNISWSASSDTFGVSGYTLYRNGVALATLTASTRSYSDTTVAPRTSYSYQVDAFDAAGNRSSKSSVVSMTTSALPSYPVVAAAGDIACSPGSSSFNGGNGTATNCRQKYTSNSLANARFSAVLPLGDIQYEAGEYNNFLNSYHPSWGRVKSITRPAVGNHEYRTSGAAGYFQYFGAAAGDPSKGYYSFNLGSWHLIALNSSIARDASSAQVRWLANDLAANTKPCVLAYWHHPRWSSGSNHGSDASVAPFWNTLHAARADVVLVGHDHLYERFALQNTTGGADPNGIRQFTVGTGGKSLYPFGTIRANSEARNNTTYGVLMLKLQPSSYSWRFIPEAGKTYTDSGSTTCH